MLRLTTQLTIENLSFEVQKLRELQKRFFRITRDASINFEEKKMLLRECKRQEEIVDTILEMCNSIHQDYFEGDISKP